MSRSDEARRRILSSIRQSLAESAPHDVVHAERHEPPTPADRARSLPILSGNRRPAPEPPAPELPLSRFAARLEAVAGKLAITRGEEAAISAVVDVLQATSARRVAASDAAIAGSFARVACDRTGAELLVDAAADALFDVDVGISTAQWGIAETGTLVLESRGERHRFVSLIPRIHIALLPAERICATLGEALQRTREDAAPGEVPSAAVTLVTGPSRTSDIELTLAIGVHGPEELHVIVMEPADDPGGGAADPELPTHPERAT